MDYQIHRRCDYLKDIESLCQKKNNPFVVKMTYFYHLLRDYYSIIELKKTRKQEREDAFLFFNPFIDL